MPAGSRDETAATDKQQLVVAYPSMHGGKEYVPLEAGPVQLLTSFNSQVFKECGATR
jgi:hypothetical protein